MQFSDAGTKWSVVEFIFTSVFELYNLEYLYADI